MMTLPSWLRANAWTPIVIGVLFIVSACVRGRSAPRPTPASTVSVGACADPNRDGVLSASPRIERADRDLDGDRQPEAVAADRRLCTDDGNCYWNLYARPQGHSGCWRYLGTVEARAIDRLRSRGEDGYHHLRGWWALDGDQRFLLQEYRYRHGGYQLVEAMLCRHQGDDKLLCASENSVRP